MCDEIGTFIHFWWACKNDAATWEHSPAVPQKVKHLASIWQKWNFLDVYPKEMKMRIYRKTCVWIFSVALFMVTKTCPLRASVWRFGSFENKYYHWCLGFYKSKKIRGVFFPHFSFSLSCSLFFFLRIH